MESFELTEQLTVEAFITALETCKEEGVELPESVRAVAQSPEKHVTELSTIAKQHPQFNASYITARKLLQKSESVLGKRVNTHSSVSSISHGTSAPSILDSVVSSSSPLGIPALRLSPAVSGLVSGPLLSSLEEKTIPDSNPNVHNEVVDAHQSFVPSVHSTTQKSQKTNLVQPVIYRYTLPDTSSPQALIAFSNQIEAIRQSNPDWVISFDRPKAGEADAIILIRRDEHYASTHAAYLMNQTLNEVVAPALSKVFGSSSSKTV